MKGIEINKHKWRNYHEVNYSIGGNREERQGIVCKKGEVQVKKTQDKQFTILIKAKIIFNPN